MANEKLICGVVCGICWLLIVLIVLLVSIGTVEPIEYGIVYNAITKKVDTATVYTGGWYFVGIFNSFVPIIRYAMIEWDAIRNINSAYESEPLKVGVGANPNCANHDAVPIWFKRVSTSSSMPQQKIFIDEKEVDRERGWSPGSAVFIWWPGRCC